MNNSKDSIRYEIIEHLHVLSEAGATVKQANVVSWYGAEPVLDIRNWSKDGKPLKGITISKSELSEFVTILDEYFERQE